jgi:glutamine amidotransferase
MGNLQSVRNAFEFLGVPTKVSREREDIERAEAIVLPGVGAFGEAMENLCKFDLVRLLDDQVRGKRKPFLGICLGMQLIAEDSEEGGDHRGLGWIAGHVVSFPHGADVRVPHVGWSDVDPRGNDPLFADRRGDAYYFDHSYCVTCSADIITASTQVGVEVVAAIRDGNIAATQFHPEKSQRAGLRLLRNFVNDIIARRH